MPILRLKGDYGHFLVVKVYRRSSVKISLRFNLLF